MKLKFRTPERLQSYCLNYTPKTEALIRIYSYDNSAQSSRNWQTENIRVKRDQFSFHDDVHPPKSPTEKKSESESESEWKSEREWSKTSARQSVHRSGQEEDKGESKLDLKLGGDVQQNF